MDDQEVCAGVNCRLDRSVRAVDGCGEFRDGTAMLHLQAVERLGVVGRLRHPENGVEVSYDLVEAHSGHLALGTDAGRAKACASMRVRTESIFWRAKAGTVEAREGFGVQLTASLFVSSLITRARKVPFLTSRATVRKACGRSMTTLPSVTDGTMPF